MHGHVFKIAVNRDLSEVLVIIRILSENRESDALSYKPPCLVTSEKGVGIMLDRRGTFLNYIHSKLNLGIFSCAKPSKTSDTLLVQGESIVLNHSTERMLNRK